MFRVTGKLDSPPLEMRNTRPPPDEDAPRREPALPQTEPALVGWFKDAPAASESPAVPADKARLQSLDFFYGQLHALKNISLNFPEKQVTALIGPSGCGKTTL